VALPGATLVNHWFARQRALAVTLSHIGAEIGGTILTPLVALLVLNVGWRQAAIVSGLTFLLLIPLLTGFVRNTPESMGLRPDGDPPPDPQRGGTEPRGGTARPAVEFSVRAALRTRSFWRLACAIGVRQFSKQALMVHLIPLLVWKGFDEPTAALFLGIFALTQVPFRVVAAQVADRWSMNRVSALSGLAGVCAVAVLLAPDHGWVGTGLLFSLLFALAETGNSSGWAVIGDFFGRTNYASIRGAISSVQTAISLPAPVLAGWVFDSTDSYQLALVPVAGCYLLTFVLFWWLQRPGEGQTAPGH
jgi:sugar phosphate permease